MTQLISDRVGIKTQFCPTSKCDWTVIIAANMDSFEIYYKNMMEEGFNEIVEGR